MPFVSVVAMCPTMYSCGRGRDVCFLRELAAFVHEFCLLVQAPSAVPAVYDISSVLEVQPLDEYFGRR